MDQQEDSIVDFFLRDEDFSWLQAAQVQQQLLPGQRPDVTMTAAQTFAAIPLIPLQQQPYSPLHDRPFNLQEDLLRFSTLSPQSLPSQPQGTPSALGQPNKIRKKPGRKPNPATPFLRKEQNRAAQRAFRERKEQHLRELEILVQGLKKERKTMAKELSRAKEDARTHKAECCYLKGLVLTLHLVCLHHGIAIPNHTPFMTKEEVNEMGRKSPFAVDVYELAQKQYETEMNKLAEDTFSADVLDHGRTCNDSMINDEDTSDEIAANAALALKSPSENIPLYEAFVDEENSGRILTNGSGISTSPAKPSMTKEREAIGKLCLQLRTQSKLSTIKSFTSGLRPSFLQIVVPHDSRIDLVPNAYMRDRLILFKDLIDYERCFKELVNGSVFHGGDPTDPSNWDLSVHFLSEYWYLCAKYDGRYHKGWCMLKSLYSCDDGLRENIDYAMRTDLQAESHDDFVDEFVNVLPNLHPQHTNDMKAAASENDASCNFAPYNMFRSPPSLRDPIRSPTLDTMVEAMSILQALETKM